MTESLISHWTDAQCREVLEQLLADEKDRLTHLYKMMPSGESGACLLIGLSARISEHKSKRKAQAWLDQQWKDYVEGMRTVQSPETIPCRLCNGTGKRMVVYRKKLIEWECCDCKGEGRLPVLPNRP